MDQVWYQGTYYSGESCGTAAVPGGAVWGPGSYIAPYEPGAPEECFIGMLAGLAEGAIDGTDYTPWTAAARAGIGCVGDVAIGRLSQ